MIRHVLIASLAASALAACTATNDPYYRTSASNPPGWVDRNRDGIDDRTQGSRTNPNNPPGWVDRNRDGVDDRTQGSRTNPNNPPGWVDRNRDGVDDRVEQRRATSYRGGYYDSYGVWHAY